MIRSVGRIHNPVAVRELRRTMRVPRNSVILVGYVAVLAALGLGLLLAQSSPGSDASVRLGARLFHTLAIAQLLLILVVAPAFAADALAGEKDRRTWDPLLMTRLSSWTICSGKLVSAWMYCLLLLVASLPMFCVVFLFGGVSTSDIVRIYAVLAGTALTMTALGLFISSLLPSALDAVITASAASLIGCLLPASLMLRDGWSGMTALALLNPPAALVSALPGGKEMEYVGALGGAQYPVGDMFGIGAEYDIVAIAAALLLLLATSRRIRRKRTWPDRRAV